MFLKVSSYVIPYNHCRLFLAHMQELRERNTHPHTHTCMHAYTLPPKSTTKRGQITHFKCQIMIDDLVKRHNLFFFADISITMLYLYIRL